WTDPPAAFDAFCRLAGARRPTQLTVPGGGPRSSARPSRTRWYGHVPDWYEDVPTTHPPEPRRGDHPCLTPTDETSRSQSWAPACPAWGWRSRCATRGSTTSSCSSARATWAARGGTTRIPAAPATSP